MSTRELKQLPIMYMRNSRRSKMVLDVDLNVPPPSDSHNHHQGGSSAHAAEQDGFTQPPPPQPPTQPPPLPLQTQAIDLEAIDDDVVISSPRAFFEVTARNNSRRTLGRTIVVDVEEAEAGSSTVIPYQRMKRRRITQNASTTANQKFISCDNLLINLEGQTAKSKKKSSLAIPILPPPLPPPLPPKEPTFSCPVCMGPLVEEMSTKCGHIFCKACIKAAITAQNKCPTCRRKITMKDTIRVYLPTTN